MTGLKVRPANEHLTVTLHKDRSDAECKSVIAALQRVGWKFAGCGNGFHSPESGEWDIRFVKEMQAG